MKKWLSLELSFLLIVSVVAVGGLLNLTNDSDDITAHASLKSLAKKIKREIAKQQAQLPKPQPPAPQPTPPVPQLPQPVPQPAPVPVIPITPPPALQPTPLPCPALDSRGWECFSRERYKSCPAGFEIAVPLASTSCTFCCMPSTKPTCKVDVGNCPDSIKRFFTTTLISGEPSRGGDMCTIDNNLLSNEWNRGLGLYYWKYNAPCGRVIQRA